MSLPDHESAHESSIKTPRQLLITVILSFLIPIVVIIMLVNMVGSFIQTGAGSTAQTPEAIAKRIQPVATLKLVDANAPRIFKTGQQVFESTCTACHTAGVSGAPKFGDSASWAPFVKQGYESLVKNAIHGIGAMPPKGGNPSLDDFEVERAVVYMANHSGAKFAEPEAPAAGAAKAEPAAAPAAAAPVVAAAAPAAAAPAAAAKPAEAPAAQPAAAPVPAAADAAVSTNAVGDKLYHTVCFACHATGAAGAPKVGDKASWEPFLKTGIDTMLQKAISGVGAMPPRGGSQATDAELKAAIEYMVDATK